MKTLIATLAAVGALTAVAAPAAAQPYGYGHGRYEHGTDRYDLRGQSLGRLAMTRVSHATERGMLSPREADRLQRQARDLYTTEARLGGNGLDPRERQYVQDRFNRIMARLDRDSHDRQYGSGYYR
jgi:hypothetical protein